MTIKEAFESLAKVTSKGMKNPFFVMRGLNKAFNDIASTVEGGGGGNYSTDETKVGTWVDGSDIYQKTFILRENSVDKYTKANNLYSNVLPSGIKYIQLAGMFALRGTGYADVQNISGEVNMVPDIKTCAVYFSSSHAHTDIILTFKYVK